MKKLFLLLFPLTLLLHSCMDGDPENISGVEQGVVIYNMGRIQADLDLDPLLLAFKLNTLIVTAAQEGQSYTNVEVNIGGDGSEEDDPEEWVNLKDRLFGEFNGLDRSANQWTVEFNNNTVLQKERYYRRGEITIDTQGITLDELSAGQSWEVTVPSTGYEVVTSSGQKYISRFDHYTITAISHYCWNVSGYSTAYYDGYEQTAAKWPFEYEITLSGDGTFHYDDMVRSVLLLNGDNEGTPVNAGSKLRYTAKDLKYKPRCYFSYIFGGVEFMQADRSAFPEELFPETTVKYTWYDYSYSSPCYISVQISYNGYTVNG